MEEIANLLLKSGIVEINFEKPFKFTSGRLSPIYCDNRILLSQPENRKLIINELQKKIIEQNLLFDIISGIATASIPWASMLAFALDKPLIYVRKSDKSHGLMKRIEGKFKKRDRVLLIEDLISTGTSAIDSIMALRQAGLIVEHCFAIFTYNIDNANKKFWDIGVRAISLTDITELLGITIKKRIITKNQSNDVYKALGILPK